jgi:DNA-binding response OmpR family regulator
MRVLIIEDETKIAQTIKRGLLQESFAVDICNSGEQGLELIAYEPYDVIILDRMLAGQLDGVAVCDILRKKNIAIPVLMLTARDTTADRVVGLNSGADDYLIKPFDFEELLARLRALLRRPSEVKDIILTCKDLSLNTITKEVVRAGVPVLLTAKEFALLEYLLRHKHQLVTKKMVIGHVWDYDSIVVSNNVEVYIRYLRNKIDRPFTEQLIHTVRGFGYRLD